MGGKQLPRVSKGVRRWSISLFTSPVIDPYHYNWGLNLTRSTSHLLHSQITQCSLVTSIGMVSFSKLCICKTNLEGRTMIWHSRGHIHVQKKILTSDVGPHMKNIINLGIIIIKKQLTIGVVKVGIPSTIL